MNISPSTQKGVSLLITLIMLMVISMIGVSAVRMSSQDLMIASNEQQQMLVNQTSESSRREVVSFYNLFQWLEEGTIPASRVHTLDSGEIKTTIALTQGIDYPCLGQSGEAMSIGAGMNKCRAYNFSVKSKLQGTGAIAERFKSEGKELPRVQGTLTDR